MAVKMQPWPDDADVLAVGRWTLDVGIRRRIQLPLPVRDSDSPKHGSPSLPSHVTELKLSAARGLCFAGLRLAGRRTNKLWPRLPILGQDCRACQSRAASKTSTTYSEHYLYGPSPRLLISGNLALATTGSLHESPTRVPESSSPLLRIAGQQRQKPHSQHYPPAEPHRPVRKSCATALAFGEL